MTSQTLENELIAWRTRFPQYGYCPQDDCVALKLQRAYGCHCDLDPEQKPDGCVLDGGRVEDCVEAQHLVRQGKCKTDCKYWLVVKET